MNVDLERLMQATLEAVRLGEDPDFTDLEEAFGDLADATALVEALHETERWVRAATAVRNVFRSVLASMLGEGGVMRYGDTIVRYSAQYRNKCTDPEGFFAWLETQPDAAKKFINPDYVKVGSLPQPVRDTFFIREPRGPKVNEVPRDRAPQWLQELDEGEIRRRG